ncbi:hypothetical protein AVEN_106963-1 [Araneus ventricosus]|uniref:Uncharacterized protein n=1 Tax=Araneus ventricosus TaxID=182803 RepID=A0A4Y2Q7B1_ARAVE|nr:hypothetical protein AVEN_106963-1 [Araneus ventricosus]
MFISQYPPPDMGNSFCLVVSTLDSNPKCLRFQSTYCQSGDPEEHTTPTFSPTTRRQHQISHQIHLLLHPIDGSTSTSTPSSSKVYDHFIAQSLYVLPKANAID